MAAWTKGFFGKFWQACSEWPWLLPPQKNGAIIGIALGMLVGRKIGSIVRCPRPPYSRFCERFRPWPGCLFLWLSSEIAIHPLFSFYFYLLQSGPLLSTPPLVCNRFLRTIKKNVARVLRLSRKDYFFEVLFPATVPYIFTGLRIGIGLSWLAIIAAEMLIGGVGIGFFIWDAWNSSRMSEIVLSLIYVGVVGLLLDRMIAFIEHRIVPNERT